MKGFLHFIELEGLDDRLDFFHIRIRSHELYLVDQSGWFRFEHMSVPVFGTMRNLAMIMPFYWSREIHDFGRFSAMPQGFHAFY
jgi:hypothetical protein